MKLTVIGCAGSFPAPDSPCSAYLVEAEGFKLLIDFGSGSLGNLQNFINPHDLDAVILTHLHADHFFDACPYAVMRRYAPTGPYEPLRVYGPENTHQRLVDAYGGEGEHRCAGLTDVYDVHTLKPSTFDLGPFSITVDRVTHPVETFGVRLEYLGRSLTYSSDTGPSAALDRLAAHCDVLLAEAAYTEERENPKGVHLTGKEAGECATKAGAGRLLLTHLVHSWGSAETALSEARQSYTGPVEVVRPGAVYEL